MYVSLQDLKWYVGVFISCFELPLGGAGEPHFNRWIEAKALAYLQFGTSCADCCAIEVVGAETVNQLTCHPWPSFEQKGLLGSCPLKRGMIRLEDSR